MKECPSCRKVYSDDLFFCLDDGSPIRKIGESVDPTAPTEVAYDVSSSLRTEVLPSQNPIPKTAAYPVTDSPAVRPSSKLPYVAIAVLVLACLAMAGTLVVLNLDRIIPKKDSNNQTPGNIKNTSVSASAPTPTPETTHSTNAVPPSSNKAVKQTSATYNPSGKWTGEWSTASGTLFDFDLTLTDTGNNSLDGQVEWTMRRTARPDKADKVGFSAIEFVRGSYDPATGAVNLSGYGKDDPNNVLVMLDVYRLKISEDGRTLAGSARNGGKWNGRVRLSR